jgi:acetyl/propionyl-CoA carboxylase alpha subunit
MRCLAAVADLNTQGAPQDPVTTIALYGTADVSAWFVRAADEAVPVGAVPTVLQASADDVLTALAATGADAVWLGWGALACDTELVRRCRAAGLVVVGPGQLDRPAPDVGPVTSPHRRVEVQVVADGATVWVLGLRDSSVRRQGEPVLIETDCTALDPGTARRLQDTARTLALHAGFVGCGSVEFGLAADGGDPVLLAFHPCLRAGHPVVEATTGLDLVALQLVLASGRPLTGQVPVAVGHAVEVRLLAADPERDFAPTGGRLSFLRLPVGPGVRVDLGLTEGDVVDPAAGPLLATVVAAGRDRDEAHARLRRALGQLIVVIDGGTTTKAVLAHELASSVVRAGDYDCTWLDRVVAAGDFLPPPDPLALLAAAVEVFDGEEASVRDAFLAAAARGRPSLPAAGGHLVELRMRGAAYPLAVYRTGPEDYRVVVDTNVAVDVQVRRLSQCERSLTVGDRSHRVVIDDQHAALHVEVDGIPHRVLRDGGVTVRAELPAFVVDVIVESGQSVRAGDALFVLESMKMATTVTAPVAGVVRALFAGVHTQVEVGAALAQLSPDEMPRTDGDPVDLRSLAAGRELDAHPAHVHRRLRSLLLGYDLDGATTRRLPDLQRAAAAAGPADDPALVAHELDLVEIFTDICALSRRDPDPRDAVGGDHAASAQEHLFTYLARPAESQESVPAAFLARLEAALARYDIPGRDRTEMRASALVPMYRSFLNARDLSWMVTSTLERWLAHRSVLAPAFADRHRAAIDRLFRVMPGRSDVVADLAREVHYRYVDEPLLEQTVARAEADVGEWLRALVGADEELAAEAGPRLVGCPRPLRAVLRDGYLAADDRGRRRLLEVRLRRYYRNRPLEDVQVVTTGDHLACTARYVHEGRTFHIVSGYCDRSRIADFVNGIAPHLRTLPAQDGVVVDLEVWSTASRLDVGELSVQLAAELDSTDPGHALHRVDVSVTSAGSEEEHRRTQHVSLRQRDGGFVEDLAYRNLHPMIAKRLDLSRWSAFDLTRLPSAEDVYLFAATAKGNPADSRLVAFAEVRDLTPARDSAGRVTGYPLLERMLSEAFTCIRHVTVSRDPKTRPRRNRVVLHVRPPWDVASDAFRDIAHRWASVSDGLSLEMVQLSVDLPTGHPAGDGPATIAVTGAAGHGVTILVGPRSDVAVQPLSDYEQRVLKAERAGAPYPYELLRMLTPPQGAPSDFPPGVFTEHDLVDGGSSLQPVERPAGENTCGLVAGILTSYPPAIPEGMPRVVLLGDPTRDWATSPRPSAGASSRPSTSRSSDGCRWSGTPFPPAPASRWTAARRTWTGSPLCCAGSSSSRRPAARSTSSSRGSTSVPSRTGTPRRRCSCTPAAFS